MPVSEVADVAGCRIIVSPAPLASHLREAVASARAPWLLFLKPGIVLDRTWVDEAAHFVDVPADDIEGRAPAFRSGAGSRTRPLLVEPLSLLHAALGRTAAAGARPADWQSALRRSRRLLR